MKKERYKWQSANAKPNKWKQREKYSEAQQKLCISIWAKSFDAPDQALDECVNQW